MIYFIMTHHWIYFHSQNALNFIFIISSNGFIPVLKKLRLSPIFWYIHKSYIIFTSLSKASLFFLTISLAMETRRCNSISCYLFSSSFSFSFSPIISRQGKGFRSVDSIGPFSSFDMLFWERFNIVFDGVKSVACVPVVGSMKLAWVTWERESWHNCVLDVITRILLQPVLDKRP